MTALAPRLRRASGVSMRRLARAQGLYFLTTGLWPLVSMRTFEAVTGPKRERWLIKTVGVLVAVIGASLLAAGRRQRVDPAAALLAAGSAAGLGGVDLAYTARRRISRVYLLDAVLEALVVGAWLVAARRAQRRHSGGWAKRSGAIGHP